MTKTSIESGATIEQTILNGVGKKTRLSFQRGEISASKVKSIYAHNLKEAEEFCAFGLKVGDLRSLLCSCHNPILKTKIEECIKAFETKSHMSRDQNKQSIEKLNNFLSNAIGGVGLKRVIRILRKKARKSKDSTLKVVSTLLEAEYANLCAKTHGKLKEVIYERKSLLLDKIAYWLDGTNWSMATTQTVARTPHILYMCTYQMVFSCRGIAQTTTSTRDSPILKPNGMARFARRWRNCWRISIKITLRFSRLQQYVLLNEKIINKKNYKMRKENKQKLYCSLALSAVTVVGAFIIGMCNHKPTTMKVISCRPVNDMAGLIKNPCNINCQFKSF